MSQTFTVRDFKGCREIELSPTGRLVVIAGGNGAGKSSFIDAIAELFDPKGTKLTPKPIRDGADEARAEYVDDALGLRISRVWKRNGTAGTLTVEALDGAKYPSPSGVVADLLGGAIFDPVAFLNLSEKAQRDALLEKVDLPVDLDEITRGKAAAEMRRLEAGREVKRLTGALSALPKPAEGVPDEEVSASDLIAALQDAQDAHRVNQSYVARAEALTARIAELEAELLEAHEDRDALQGRIRGLADLPDVGALQARLAAVDDTNRAVRAAHQYQEVAGELEAAETLHEIAQADLNDIERRKAEGLAAAVFPVDGLSVDDTGVTFDGIPFVQSNTATQMRVAFAIATAGRTKLRLVIVRNGDLLDDDSLAALAEMADSRGYTALVERDRDASRRIGFVVRDGVLDDA